MTAALVRSTITRDRATVAICETCSRRGYYATTIRPVPNGAETACSCGRSAIVRNEAQAKAGEDRIVRPSLLATIVLLLRHGRTSREIAALVGLRSAAAVRQRVSRARRAGKL